MADIQGTGGEPELLARNLDASKLAVEGGRVLVPHDGEGSILELTPPSP